MKYNIIDYLGNRYSVSYKPLIEVLENHYLKQNVDSTEKDDIKLPQDEDVVLPDRKYVEKLIEELWKIKNNFGDYEFEKCLKGLKEILEKDDFDDAEEIIFSVHELIEKYIYGSDTKVSASDWKKLENYIENAGYKPVPVKIGDDITPYKVYFNRPIVAKGGTVNKIRHIQLQPFVLKYMNDDTIETIKLCGKCTYYK
ncbi:MAG: hypothetical protein K2J39_11810 [Ruminococcus sp.]|nr:hypothetical protein [Ruminococcus sp.]